MNLFMMLLIAGAPAAMVNKERDRQAILGMAGAYVVSFHFEETVGFMPGYQLKEPYDSAAVERVAVVENTENKIVLQHVLQTQRGIVKHWRQDWLFENATLLEFQGNRHWVKRKLDPSEVKGTWTQRVFQVDDSPRYEALGRWIHRGNLSQWESEATNRPLPRREYSKRDDYQIMVATNRHTLTLTGWVHEQDNYKLRLNDEDGEVIARETGLNRYDLTLDRNVAEADAWWQERAPFWADVRDAWAATFAAHDELRLKAKVDDKPLYKHMFSLGNEVFASGSYESEKAKPAIRKIIESFLDDPPSVQVSAKRVYGD